LCFDEDKKENRTLSISPIKKKTRIVVEFLMKYGWRPSVIRNIRDSPGIVNT
jgi:phosphopantetheine adenylyltransferase